MHGDKQIQRNVYRWLGFSTPLCGLLHARLVNGDRILTVRQLAGVRSKPQRYRVKRMVERATDLITQRTAQYSFADLQSLRLVSEPLHIAALQLKLMCAHSVDAFGKHVLVQRVTRLAAVTV